MKNRLKLLLTLSATGLVVACGKGFEVAQNPVNPFANLATSTETKAVDPLLQSFMVSQSKLSFEQMFNIDYDIIFSELTFNTVELIDFSQNQDDIVAVRFSLIDLSESNPVNHTIQVDEFDLSALRPILDEQTELEDLDKPASLYQKQKLSGLRFELDTRKYAELARKIQQQYRSDAQAPIYAIEVALVKKQTFSPQELEEAARSSANTLINGINKLSQSVDGPQLPNVEDGAEFSENLGNTEFWFPVATFALNPAELILGNGNSISEDGSHYFTLNATRIDERTGESLDITSDLIGDVIEDVILDDPSTLEGVQAALSRMSEQAPAVAAQIAERVTEINELNNENIDTFRGYAFNVDTAEELRSYAKDGLKYIDEGIAFGESNARSNEMKNIVTTLTQASADSLEITDYNSGGALDLYQFANSKMNSLESTLQTLETYILSIEEQKSKVQQFFNKRAAQNFDSV